MTSDELKTLALTLGMQIAAAYVADRAEQFTNGSSCRGALEDAAFQIRKGDALEAFNHGELDDIFERWGFKCPSI